MTDMPQQGEFCWNELMTADTGQAKEFYGKLFGWTFQDFPMGDMTYSMFKIGEKSVAGLLPIPSQEAGKIPPHWISYILVTNLEETVQKAQDLGGQIKIPITVVNGFGRFSMIIDPTGAHIAVWQPFTQG